MLVGVNGIGKTTILRILAGELQPDDGEFALGGTVLTMSQDAGMAAPDATLREMLIEVAPPVLRTAGRALVAAEAALAPDATRCGAGDGVRGGADHVGRPRRLRTGGAVGVRRCSGS